MKRRQASSTCFPYFRTQYGLEGIIQACRCLRPSSAIATTTITLSTRATSGTTTVTASWLYHSIRALSKTDRFTGLHHCRRS